MATKENIIVSVATEFDGKALAKGQKKLTDFEKTTLKVGKIFGSVFAAQKIVAFGKDAVHAFLESEKAGKALNQTLTNLGMAYKSPAIDGYLNKLSLQVGIVDEELKPAYNQLLLSTRNTAEAQNLLNTALDVSAGTGKDLASVTAALSKAYVGNNTAISKLGIGLSKAQLTTMKFSDIQKELNSLFQGQAAAAAQGYTGDIAKLTVAYDQFKESIGKGILSGLSANGNIDQATASITKLGSALGVTTGYLVKFATGWAQLFDKNVWTKFWDELTGKAVVQVDAGSDRGGAAKAADQRATKLAQLQSKTAMAQTTAAKASTAASKAALLLSKGGSVLDVQQAEIYAALQGKITDQEKLRLDLSLALLTNNAAAAYSLGQELLVSQLRTTDLASTIANMPKALNPFSDWPKYIQDLIQQMSILKGAIPSPSVSTTPTPTQGNTSGGMALADLQRIAEGQRNRLNDEFSNPESGAYNSSMYGASNATYNINVDATNMVDPNNLTTVVQNAILLINRNGLSTVPAGQGF
jgi:hypothetical protein